VNICQYKEPLSASLAGCGQLLDSIYNPLVIIDPQGIVSQCNKSFLLLFELERPQIIGLPLENFIENTELVRIISTGKPETMRRINIRGKAYLSNRTLLRDKDVVTGAIAVLHDVSEIEAVSGELRNVTILMQELDAFMEAVNEGIYIADGEGKTLRVNRAYERLAGLSREEVLGQKMEDLVKLGFIDQSVTMQVLREKKPISILQRLRSGLKAVVSGTPLFDENGDIYRVVTSVRDAYELNRLKEQLEQATVLNDTYRKKLNQLQAGSQSVIIYRSAIMCRLVDFAVRLGSVDSNVIILGESGVGKELFAELIHRHSARAKNPFIRVNCTAIPEQLFESEFFGYVRGAFTGANKEGKAGIFEAANTGTVLLDEIGDMPLSLQAKLLRVIQERCINRVGDVTPRKIDVRILCSSNKDLRAMVEQGLFREDLYYRLTVVPLLVPPLRERSEDIPFLVQFFMKKFCSRYSLERIMLPESVDLLSKRPWFGNVRELENCIERLVVTSVKSEIYPKDVPLTDMKPYEHSAIHIEDQTSEIGNLRSILQRVEMEILRKAFAKHKSSRKVAAALGIDQSTALRKARKLGLLSPALKNIALDDASMDKEITNNPMH